LTFSSLLVLKVGVFEFSADIEGNSELIMSLLWLFGLDQIEDGEAVDGVSASDDDGVADLSDQHNKPGWGVVVLRVLPDQQNCLHDGCEEVNHLWEIGTSADQVMEKI
jgi:hypothetical protein